MQKTKYVVVDTGLSIAAVIGPASLNHSQIADGCGRPITAGFMTIGSDPAGKIYIDAYGDSVSLRLKAEPEVDRKLIARALGLDPERLAT